jgi:NADPH:quinone reductase-like Zn-dependent oxidoreductase
MKAVLQPRSGSPDVLTLAEIERPVPGDRDILVRVHAATVTMGDVMLRTLPRWVLRAVGLVAGFKPKVVAGVEFAGEVVAAGPSVTRFAVGDRVFGTTTGLATGANAEYLCIPERWKHGVVMTIPAGVAYTDAAALPVGGMTALQLLRKAGVRAGQHVLVYGASGSVGSYAVQIARHLGASVTGVCSTANVDLVHSIGAESVVDYTREDVTTRGGVYDVVFDAVGKFPRAKAKALIGRGGSHISIKSMTNETADDLAFLAALAAEGRIRAVIDRHYTLEQVVDAHRYVESGRKKGNVIIDVLTPDAFATGRA